MLSATNTETTPSILAVAVKSRWSCSSASVKCILKSISTLSVVRTRFTSSISIATIGSALTSTMKVSITYAPQSSVAVTVMVASPGELPSTSKTFPVTTGFATNSSSEVAVNVKVSPASGSLKCSESVINRDEPWLTTISAIAVSRTGTLLTRTSNVWDVDPPDASVAVIVTVVSPAVRPTSAR